MTSAQSFTHSTTPILQAWLIKGLRLVYSKKPGDREKLQKLYEEACENEAQVCRITINEALKEPRDNLAMDVGERENPVLIHPSPSRIRPVQLIGESQLVSSSQTSSTNLSESNSNAPTTPVASAGRPNTNTTSTGNSSNNNRSKVAFFDIFGSSSTPSVSTSQSTTHVSTASQEPTVLPSSSNQTSVLTKSLPSQHSGSVGESSLENPGSNGRTKSSSLDSSVCLPCAVPLRSDIPPNTIIDLTCTEPTDGLSVLSAAASALGTKSTISSSSVTSTTTVTMSTPLESTLTPSKSDDIPSTADPKLLASLVADLACSVCGKLTTQPQMEPDGKTMNANILIECIQCGALYHQLCHQPPILSAKPIIQREWRCGNCSATELTDVAPTTGANKLVKPVEELASTSSSQTPPASKKPRQVGVELLINVPSIGARKRKPGFVPPPPPQSDISRKLS